MKKHFAYTEHFLRDGLSKYGDVDLRYKPLFMPDGDPSFKTAKKKDGSLIIEGWFSTTALDADNEIIPASAFESSIAEFLEDPLLMFMHDWWGQPIGKILTAEIKPEGLWGTAQILPTSQGKDIILLSEEGVLRRFSIGFFVKKRQYDEETSIGTIIDLALKEVSVVNLGSNPLATYNIAKSKNLKINIPYPFPDGGEHKRKEKGMDPEVKKAIEELEARFHNTETVVEQFQKQYNDLSESVAKLERLKVDVGEEAKKLAKGLITQDEFKTRTDKMAEDIILLTKRIDEAANADKVRKMQYPVKDWRALSKDYVWLYDDKGRAMPEMHQRAYKLFQAQVDMDSTEEGRIVKLMRECYDSVLLSDAVFRSQFNPHRNSYQPQQLKSFQQLMQLVSHFDPEFAKAMSSEASGLGDEWVMTGWSSELIDLLEVQPTIANIFKTVTMTQNPQLFLKKTSTSTAYVASEAASNNPDILKRSDMGTAQGQFTTFNLATHVPSSPELIEDSVIDIVAEIRSDIVESHPRAKDNIVCNGDTTATHRDTNQSYTAGVSPETMAMGLRYEAIDLSTTFDTQSASSGVGDGTVAFHEKDCRYLSGLLTPAYATSPKKLHYVVNVATWILMKSFDAVADASKNGIKSTWGDGSLDSLDGSPIHITEALSKDLNTTGVDDGSNADHSVVILVHEDGYHWGSRRTITVEYDKNIFTQQLGFVATQRIDLEKRVQDAVKPVAMGLNIETP